MFLGEDRHSVDDKARMVLPSRHRKALEDGLVIAKGKDRQLKIYPPDVYARIVADMQAVTPDTPEGRRKLRTFYSAADQQTLDKAGRVLLKPDLRQFADIELPDEVVVVGFFDHLELWNTEAYANERSRGDEAFVEIADDERGEADRIE